MDEFYADQQQLKSIMKSMMTQGGFRFMSAGRGLGGWEHSSTLHVCWPGGSSIVILMGCEACMVWSPMGFQAH